MLCWHGLTYIYIFEGRVSIKELKYWALSTVEACYETLDKFLRTIQNNLSFIFFIQKTVSLWHYIVFNLLSFSIIRDRIFFKDHSILKDKIYEWSYIVMIPFLFFEFIGDPYAVIIIIVVIFQN